VPELRVLGLFDHHGVRRHQHRLPADQQVSGPYCVHLLMDEGIDLMPVRPAEGRVHRKVRDVIEHRSGVRVDLAVRGATSASRSDVVLALLEGMAVLPSMLKQRGLPPYANRPLAAVSCWWAEEIVSGTDADRLRIAHALAGIDRVFVFSRNQVEIFASIGAGDKIVPVLFGVDPDWYCPDPAVSRRFQVLSVGIDRGRDFDTLLDAARLLPDALFHIVTSTGRIDPADIPANVTVARMVSMAEHRDNLRAADLVVVPTHDLAYPTGQSVLLEAMACGRCVAVTATEAMRDYIDDGVTNLAIPLHDARGTAQVIGAILADDSRRERIAAAARTAAVERFSFQRTWHEVALALDAMARRAPRSGTYTTY
jgi:glycosyltransferase involved in cell wall biosynthesis